MRATLKILLLVLFITQCFTFYLPGVAPREYHVGDPVSLKVNKLSSVDTQIPYAYYDLPFCRPAQIRDAIENLGEILNVQRNSHSILVTTKNFLASLHLENGRILWRKTLYPPIKFYSEENGLLIPTISSNFLLCMFGVKKDLYYGNYN